jgi:transcriptional antiterminator RfaH
MSEDANLRWFVVHTKPRSEKKLAAFCEKEGIHCLLPCYNSVRRYPRKIAVFAKPLFPNYLFVLLQPGQKRLVAQNDYSANILEVPDQEELAAQLKWIMQALESSTEVLIAPYVAVGKRVRIKNGPLRGVEGWVENRFGVTEVVLRLDFISQAAAVRVNAADLELLD